MSPFDFAGFKAAFEARDAERWTAFYAERAEWIEYREANPPASPNVMRGRAAIGEHIRVVAAAPLTIRIGDEVLDDRRAAFSVTIERGDGGRIVEHVILEHDQGRIVRQVDVEAWD